MEDTVTGTCMILDKRLGDTESSLTQPCHAMGDVPLSCCYLPTHQE